MYLHGPIPAVRTAFAHHQVGRANFSLALLLTEIVQHPDRSKGRMTVNNATRSNSKEGNKILQLNDFVTRSRFAINIHISIYYLILDK